MNRQETNKQILDMYNDSTYQELKANYDKTTIFNVLGVERSETRHSAFLCWLLNADANHGLGGETDGSFQQLIEHVRQNFPYIQIEEY